MANFNLNKVILGGRLTSDPELRKTSSETSVCSFCVAVNRRGKNDTADFINCTAWRATAEFIAKYFRKGSSICVVGQINTHKYVDNDGNNRVSTEVTVDEANFVDSRNESYTEARADDAASDYDDDDGLPFDM